ncbi:MAG: nucleotidyltransferase domain-containing protein [Planctomycetota bacterium]|nr:nucleotidyltransferase domain-containing protein [Planctomycetota bacterium]MDA1138298.1 nucleotidyltransferase domain-containing protein [Planctomycetota bacterium]
MEFPEILQSSLDQAVEILKEEGCAEVYLFGSIAEGKASAASDIDLAVRGCPKGAFFHIYGRLMMEMDRPVDLVDLDKSKDFAQNLQQQNELLKIA